MLQDMRQQLAPCLEQSDCLLSLAGNVFFRQSMHLKLARLCCIEHSQASLHEVERPKTLHRRSGEEVDNGTDGEYYDLDGWIKEYDHSAPLA